MTSRIPIPLRLLRRDCVQALRYLRCWLGVWGSTLAVALIISLALIGLALPWDEPIVQSIESLNAATPTWKGIARQVSYYGDFLGFNVLLFTLLVLSGWVLRSRRLLRLAVASLLCASLAGLTANLVRFGVGRPRPCAHVSDQLRGPSFDSSMQSLPSAHTATAFGASLPVLLSQTTIGGPLVLGACCVAWSRLQLERHHLTDVLVSIMIALFYALPLSQWALGARIAKARSAAAVRIPSIDHVFTSSRQP